MNDVGLRLDQAPPFSVLLRFFLTAPVFGAAAAAVVLLAGPSSFASHWNTALLAATHLLTLGFLTMVMIGALMQLLPVLAGSLLRRPRAVAAVTHVLLVIGTLSLATSFFVPATALRYAALGALGVGLGVFLVAAGVSLARAQSNPSVTAMRLALAGLAVTTLLGLLIGSDWARAFFGLAPMVTDTHLAWGLIGWVALLVIGVGYQVVPMFQLTRAYPPWMRRWLVPVAFAVLLLWTAAMSTSLAIPAWLVHTSAALIAAALATFAITTLWLQTTRKRRLPDATLRFWLLSMVSLLACVTLWAVQATGLAVDARFALLAGAWMIVGFAGSAIQGMLYKIVPFLAWLHLQARGARYALPNMKEFLPDARTLPHVWLHAAAVALIAPAAFAPMPWLYPAALALLASFLWLGWNLVSAALLYRRSLHAPPATIMS